MECSVCIEKYTKEKRKLIKCEFCDYEACSMCVKQFILGTPDSPHCMNCNKGWGRLSLSKKFTKSFMNTQYKKARENILYDLEKSMFPETQPYVVNKKRITMNMNKIRENEEKIHALKRVLRTFYVVDFETKANEIDMRRTIANFALDNEMLYYENNILSNRPVERGDAREFVKPCSRNDCKGFLSKQWKCGVCSLYTCNECHEPLDDGHECDPNNVETVKHLKTSEYKPCPACGVSIFKISGCSQMYCTNPTCRKAFDWRTGKIVTGRIHNPHYYEYMRNRGELQREIGDIQCGGLVGVQVLYNTLVNTSYSGTEQANLLEFHRQLVDFLHTILIANVEVDVFELNLSDRISHMMGYISESWFKSIIQQRDKAIQKKREIAMVSNTFLQIMSDVFNRFVNDTSIDIYKEIREACLYINSLWRDIGTAYDCVVPYANIDLIDMIKNVKI